MARSDGQEPWQVVRRHNPGKMGEGSDVDDQEVALPPVAIDDGEKENGGAFERTNQNNQKSRGHKDGKRKREVQSVNNHVARLAIERERRNKMRTLFDDLHALLPKLPPKAELLTIVDEAIRYIKTLQESLRKLETRKLERVLDLSTNTSVTSLIHQRKQTRESFLADWCSSNNHLDIIACPNLSSFSFGRHVPQVFHTWASSNVTLSVCGLDAGISICSSKKPGMLTAICFVLEKHKLDIISAQISSDGSKSMFMIHVRVNAPDKFTEAFSYDEVYKHAAVEIMLWVNSKSS